MLPVEGSEAYAELTSWFAEGIVGKAIKGAAFAQARTYLISRHARFITDQLIKDGLPPEEAREQVKKFAEFFKKRAHEVCQQDIKEHPYKPDISRGGENAEGFGRS